MSRSRRILCLRLAPRSSFFCRLSIFLTLLLSDLNNLMCQLARDVSYLCAVMTNRLMCGAMVSRKLYSVLETCSLTFVKSTVTLDYFMRETFLSTCHVFRRWEIFRHISFYINSVCNSIITIEYRSLVADYIIANYYSMYISLQIIIPYMS